MCRILGKLCNLGLKGEYYWHLAYSANTRTGTFRRLSKITGFLKTKILKFFANGPITFMNLRAVS